MKMQRAADIPKLIDSPSHRRGGTPLPVPRLSDLFRDALLVEGGKAAESPGLERSEYVAVAIPGVDLRSRIDLSTTCQD